MDEIDGGDAEFDLLAFDDVSACEFLLPNDDNIAEWLHQPLSPLLSTAESPSNGIVPMTTSTESSSSSPTLTSHDQDSNSSSRAETRRVNHRRVDAARRQKEVAAMKRLHDAATMTTTSTTSTNKQKKKLDRVGTLTAAVDKIQRLTALVSLYERERTQYNDDDDDDDVQVSTSSSAAGVNLPMRAKRRRRDDDRRAIGSSLLSSVIMTSPVGHVVVDAATGNCVFVNAAFTSVTGWTYVDIVGKPFSVSESVFRTVPEFPTEMFETATAAVRPFVTYPNGRRRQLTKAEQYPTTYALLRQLYCGQMTTVAPIIRSYSSDGDLLESHVTMSIVTVDGRRYVHIHCAPTDVVTLQADQENLNAKFMTQ